MNDSPIKSKGARRTPRHVRCTYVPICIMISFLSFLLPTSNFIGRERNQGKTNQLENEFSLVGMILFVSLSITVSWSLSSSSYSYMFNSFVHSKAICRSLHPDNFITGENQVGKDQTICVSVCQLEWLGDVCSGQL